MSGIIKEYQSFEIDFPICKDDVLLGARYRLLDAVQQSLRMHFVKAFKGSKRKERLLNNVSIVANALKWQGDYKEKTLQMIEEIKKVYLALPKEILQNINQVEDLYFGEYPDNVYDLLKNWFYAERELLRKEIFG